MTRNAHGFGFWLVGAAAWFSTAWGIGAEPQLVTDELQEKLGRVSVVETNPLQQSLEFPPQQAKFVRLAIHRTLGGSQPGIDELEVFGPEAKENLALAGRGAAADASSVISGYAIHRIAHLNDGQYGNDHSWIAATGSREWAQVELPEPVLVGRVVFSRDRTGEFRDRVPEVVEVLVSLDGRAWQTAAKSNQTESRSVRPRPPGCRYDLVPFLPVERLDEQNYDGVLRYAFLRERATCSAIPADDHLSPLVVERPAVPGGKPYWGRIAGLGPLERVLVLFEDMIDRLAAQGVDVTAERSQAADLRQRAAEEPDSDALYLAARRAKRDLFFRDPALAPIERVLFAKRHPFLESHNYSEHFDSYFQPGGGVFVLHIPRDENDRFRPDLARIEQLFDGSEGIVREPTADYDAKTVYFAYRPDKPGHEGWASYWHMYAVNADGTGLRQLTDGPFHDFDAVCLPDGGLAFNSTRCAVRFLCWRPQAYVLHRMDPDGSNIQRLSHANLSEWKPSVMRNGRILWTRSEYLDKGANFGHTLWAIHPDGTHPELIFGNNTPLGYSQAHEVPDSNEIVCTLMSHGDHNGPIALLDRGKSPFDIEAITNITPDRRPCYEMNRSHHNTFRDPYPVSRDHFLVAHNPDSHNNWGLYVIDRYGNRELLYVDPEISSKRPSPLRSRKRPPVLSSPLDPELAARGLGQFTLQDVYVGLGPKVARGQAKYLRVSEEVPSQLEQLPCGQFRADHPPFTDFYASPVGQVKGQSHSYETLTANASLTNMHTYYRWAEHITETPNGEFTIREQRGWPSYVAKTSLGTVPIEEDGSTNFLAPAGKVLYFQLLDADYNELQRMRSVVQLQPGERRSCIGCHESRQTSPPEEVGQALLQRPRSLDPPPWGAVPFDYQKVVQPVFDAHCVRCHDGSDSARVDLRGTIDNARIPASYRALIEGGWVHYFDFFYAVRPFKAEPLSFGTVKSRLFTVLADKEHEAISLEENEMRALKAWIDLNCPLWPNYIYRLNRPGPPSDKLTAAQ